MPFLFNPLTSKFDIVKDTSGLASAAFTTIQTDSGTSPVAAGATDTLTFTSTDNSVSVDGDSSTDTVDLEVDINSVAALGATADNADELLIYDADAAALKKITISQLPGGSGDVVGPASATDNAIVRFDSTTGKLVQNSGVTIDDSNNIAIPATSTLTVRGYNIVTASDASNTFLGDAAGDSITSGINHVLVGQNAGTALTSGSYHVAIGYNALKTKTTEAAAGSVAVGWGALELCTTGVGNVGIGVRAGNALTTGGSNVAVGRDSLRNVSDGTIAQTTALGYNSGLASSGGWSVYVGANAGRYNATDNRLFVNTINQGSAANDKANSLIYGEFHSTAASQILSTPGKFGVGIQAPAGKAHIDQESATAAIPVLVLDQGDIDDTFINFIGTTAADGTRSISTDTTEDSTKYGAIRIEINGTTKWIRIYDNES